MAIIRIASQDAQNSSATTSVTATYPSTPTQGNTMLASVYENVTTGLVSISGWTKIVEGAFSGTAQSVSIWAKIAGASESTSIVASGATGATIMHLHIYEYAGLASTVTTDGTNSATSGVTNVASLLSGSVSTSNAYDLVFIANAVGGTTTGQSFNNGFSIRQVDSSAARLMDADQIVTSTGNYSSTASWTGSLRAGSVIAAFKAAPLASGVAFDNAVAGQSNGTNSISLSLSTASPNEAVIFYTHVSNTSTISSITGSGLTIVKDGSTLSLGGNGQMERWRTLAVSQQVANSITITTTGNPQMTAVMVAVSGVDTTGTNGSGFMGGETDTAGNSTALSSSVTTLRNNSLVIGGLGQTGSGVLTAGASQTKQSSSIIASGFSDIAALTQNAVTATSGTSVTMSASSTVSTNWGTMATEIMPPNIASNGNFLAMF